MEPGEAEFVARVLEGAVDTSELPVSRLAGRILQYATVNRKEEGSVLGGLGNMMDGDGW